MKIANAQTQEIAKLAVKQEAEEPQPIVKKEKEVTVTAVTSLSSQDGEDRVFRCEHDGCTSSFKTRSSLRDHQKGKEVKWIQRIFTNFLLSSQRRAALSLQLLQQRVQELFEPKQTRTRVASSRISKAEKRSGKSNKHKRQR
jgi:hypothetical protein